MDMLSGADLKKKLSEPNTLTMGRVAAIPLIVILLYFPNRFCTFLAALLFSAAAITDYLDGYLARTRGLFDPWSPRIRGTFPRGQFSHGFRATTH